MKIDLDKIDREQFMVHPHQVAGEQVWLVQPEHIGAKFTQWNKIFRSSLWNSNGELISAGMPKFVNWGENPDNFPLPTALEGTNLVTKIDGSLLIVSKYKETLICRTRGTSDASKLNNGHELEILKAKYPKVFNYASDKYSILMEWVSPLQKIVIDYGEEPDLYLIGIISHEDYSLYNQKSLDIIATELDIKRPAYYNYGNIPELLEAVRKFEGIEGICLYSSRDSQIHKIKAEKYLLLHRMKSELSSFEKVLDLWFVLNQPDYDTFYQYIVNQFDHELAQQVKNSINIICEAWKECQEIRAGMNSFVEPLKGLTRKESALKIIAAYGESGRSGMVFQLLDGKNFTNEIWKKLILQITAK